MKKFSLIFLIICALGQMVFGQYPAPELIYPSSGYRAISSPVFQWTNAINAGFRFGISPNSDMTFPIIDKVFAANTNFYQCSQNEWDQLVPNQNYYWSVATRDPNSNFGPWAPSRLIKNTTNLSPYVDSVRFEQRCDETLIVDVYYYVTDPEGDPMNVSMNVSDDEGVTWNFPCNLVSGDIGGGITSGSKHIEWNYKNEHPDVSGNQFKIKITAVDDTMVNGMPCPGIPIVEYLGQVYNTVKIGDQCWLKENLNVGNRIDGIQEQTDNSIIEKYCYNDLESNCNIYGGLYQWNETMQYSLDTGSRGICPVGWHIPTYFEWVNLIESFGCYYYNYSNGIIHTYPTCIDTITQSGFDPIFTGFAPAGSEIEGISSCASAFWSSSQVNQNKSWLYHNGCLTSDFGSVGGEKSFGLSIRCIKDEENIGQSCPGIPEIIYEGQVYHTVQIGTQCWLRENLNVGLFIPDSIEQSCNYNIEKWCKNGIINGTIECDEFGGLYQWDEMMQYTQSEGSQGICPSGWHIPSQGEIEELISVVGLEIESYGWCLNTLLNNCTTLLPEGSSGFDLLWSGCGPNWASCASNNSCSSFIWSSTNIDENTSWSFHSGCIDELTSSFGACWRNWGLSARCIKNESNTNFGEPCPGIPEIIYEDQVYHTVKIGNQCWMKENLNIGIVINDEFEQTDNGIIEKFCYNNNSSNCNQYGGLYQVGEFLQYSMIQGTQGICPDGWHIPTTDEWMLLFGNVDSQFGVGDPEWQIDPNGESLGFDAGKNLKSSLQWNGTDLFGYNTMPGGWRHPYPGTFGELGVAGVLSTSSRIGSYDDFWKVYLLTDNNGVMVASSVQDDLRTATSVRCMMDSK